MNQDNNDFELSGTLGSLNDAALNNLNNQNSNPVEQNNTINSVLNTEQKVESEIEMLDVPNPTSLVNEVNPVPSNTELGSEEPTIIENVNSSNLENSIGINSLDSQIAFDQISTNLDMGDIGSVPPIDPTGKGEKKKKKSKIWFILILIILIAAIGGFIFYYLRISKGTVANAVEPKELNLELGADLSTNINDYANFNSISSTNCILNTKNVDVSSPGNYEYTITCGNKTYTGKITIQDSQAPNVVTKTIVKKINDTVTPEEFVDKCEESTACEYAFENAETVNNSLVQAGTYNFNVIVTDANNNSTTVPVKLIVIDTDIKVYFNCVLAEQAIENFEGSLSYIEKIGISNESQYVGLYFKINEYIATTEEEYNRIKNNYQTSGQLDINNGEGTPIFDDTNLTIRFEDTLSGEAEFGSDYASIKTYYETKNYKCNILNVN